MLFPKLDAWQFRASHNLTEGIKLSSGQRLEVDANLPVTQVTDAAGTPVGYFLGFALDLNARIEIGATWQAPVTLGTDIDLFCEQIFDAVGGRFLWIVSYKDVCRIYPDCSAQIPVVYDRKAKLVGTSAHALFDDEEYAARFDQRTYDNLHIEGEGWFPAGLTAHKGLSRVFANHYLDLETFQVHRVWPKDEVAEATDVDALVDEYISIIQAQIETLAKGTKKVGIALTAGLDTRVLLACSRPLKDDIEFLTVVGEDIHAIDSVLSARIAKKFGLRHVTLPRVTATREQRELFLRRGGHCNGDTNSRFHPSVWPIAHSHVFVGGLGAEQGRAFYWQDEDHPEMELTAEMMIRRMGLPALENCTAAIARHMSSMPTQNALRKLDLVYAEDRHSAWYAPQFCSDPSLIRHAPMLTTRTTRLMLQLPDEWKRTNRLGHEVIRRIWPELGALPYNSLGRWRDLMIKMQRIRYNPQLVLKKLRKMSS